MTVYVYRQNNSGGVIMGPKWIIVQAENEKIALDKAKEAGLYLHGVSLGTDCSCCGDRWNDFAYEFDTLLEAKSYCAQASGNVDVTPYVVKT